MLRPKLATMVLWVAGCAAYQPPFTWVHDLPATAAAGTVIQARDTIVIEVVEQPTLSGEFIVRDDGYYLQPMAGSIRVAGMTASQAAAGVTDRLKKLVVEPRVSVFVSKPAPIKISVVGEVKTPGAYEMTRDRTVVAALAAAGWVSEFAHADRIYVLRGDDAQSRVRFKLKDLTAPEPHSAQFRLRDGDVVLVE